MARDTPAVVTVHGLWTGRWAMSYLDWQLRRAGYRVFPFGYASARDSLAGNAAALARHAARIDADTLHLVGHSLGGIVICAALQAGLIPRVGRIVMLASPLTGSVAAERLAQLAPGINLLGNSIRDWLAHPLQKWELPYELGILAGGISLGMGRLFAADLPRPNDGAVTAEETRLSGAREHLLLPVSHSGILFSPRAARCIRNFLASGRFAEPASH